MTGPPAGPPRSFGPAQMTSSAGQPAQVNVLGVGVNSPAPTFAITAESSASSAGKIGTREGRRHDPVGTLEERVDDLDLVVPCPEARERVDEALQPVLRLDDLLRGALAEEVRLVVDDERAALAAVEHVEPSAEQDAVMDERERPLGPGAVEACDSPCERGLAVRPDERGDPLELLAAHVRVPLANDVEVGHLRICHVDDLEQPVGCIADLGRSEPDALRRRRAPLPKPGNAFGVVAVRAALEEGERRVRELARVVQRRARAP